MAIVEAELGKPVAELFDGLDASSEPVAAASLGQVYRARLRTTGAEVAVKVQRADVGGLLAVSDAPSGIDAPGGPAFETVAAAHMTWTVCVAVLPV